MKKLTILLLFLITNFAYSQFDLVANQTNGKFSLATNNTTFMGKTAGTIQAQVDFTVSDTSSNWTLLPNQTNGKYSIITNAVTFMGKDAGTVQIPVVFDLGSVTVAFDTSLFVKRTAYNQDITAQNEFTMSAETFMSISSSHDMVLLATNSMTLSAFSQSITATGGDMIFSAEGSFSFTTNSDFNTDVAGALYLGSGGTTTLFGNSAVNISSTSSISIAGTSLSFGVAVDKILSGGVTPATFDGYIIITINGTDRRIPFVNN